MLSSQNMFASIKSTLQHIFDNYDCLPTLYLSIIIGHSATNPKEIYLLKFVNLYSDRMRKVDENTVVTQLQQEDAAERRFLRSLIHTMSDVPAGIRMSGL